VGFPQPGATFVFNRSGQEIEIEGLICLIDAQGPCANAVKDAQRTKTDGQTRRTLSLIWGTQKLVGHAERAQTWYRALLEAQQAVTTDVLV
jgi:hypothetical protein